MRSRSAPASTSRRFATTSAAVFCRSPRGRRAATAATTKTVRFVRAVKEAQALGFTLAEIEDYLRASRRGAGRATEELRVRMAAKIDEVDERIAGLRRVRSDLARIVGCACESLDHCTCGAAQLARGGRTGGAPAGPLHVTNGDSTAWTLGRTTLGGRVLAWHDVLHEGPVPAAARDVVRTTRADFLSACGWGSAPRLREAFATRDDEFATALRDGRHVVLWFEHDLYDQLQLLDALSLAHETGVDGTLLELIVVGSFPGKPGFRGLGELTSDELETLWPGRVAVTPALAEAAHAAWTAIRAPDPHALVATSSAGVDGLPFLAPALRRLLEELPDAQTGLSRTERHILETLAQGGRRPHELFVTTQALEEAPYLGDAWFFRILAGLGQGEGRLVETVEGEAVPTPPPLGDSAAFTARELRATSRGLAALRGDADRVTLVPLDRWVLGTQLVAPAPWRWDAASARLLRG